MGLTEDYLQTSDEQIIREVLDSDDPWLEGITWERLHEEGWAKLNIPDPWLPYAEGDFPTPSGRAEFYSETLAAAGQDPLPAYVPAGGEESVEYPLTLISAKSALHFLNSSFANLPRHRKAEKEPHLLMHPQDAAPRGIVDDDWVQVCNAQGQLSGAAVIPGVVSMPSGWWASLSPGGVSANLLTPDGLSDAGGGGDFHDARVEVVRMPQIPSPEEGAGSAHPTWANHVLTEA
jgi:anaerobic selenocysteine-containing dehydrogenase